MENLITEVMVRDSKEDFTKRREEEKVLYLKKLNEEMNGTGITFNVCVCVCVCGGGGGVGTVRVSGVYDWTRLLRSGEKKLMKSKLPLPLESKDILFPETVIAIWTTSHSKLH